MGRADKMGWSYSVRGGDGTKVLAVGGEGVAAQAPGDAPLGATGASGTRALDSERNGAVAVTPVSTGRGGGGSTSLRRVTIDEAASVPAPRLCVSAVCIVYICVC